MRNVSVSNARRHLSALLQAVEAGETVIITRHGQPIASLEPIATGMSPFPDRAEPRNSVSPMSTSAAETVRELREESHYCQSRNSHPKGLPAPLLQCSSQARKQHVDHQTTGEHQVPGTRHQQSGTGTR